jgi:flagellar hook protein FlgE
MIDVTANNLSNVNTVGYKGSRTTFKDQLQQTIYGGTAGGPNTGGTNAAQVGLGVQLGSIDTQMNPGSLAATGGALDVAIQGEGWFRVGAAVGTPPAPSAGDPVPTPYATVAFNNMQYTRAGNFSRNSEGYLITPDGQYLVGQPTTMGTPAETSGSYIYIPKEAAAISVGNDGEVTYIDSTGSRVKAGTLSLAKFPNTEGMLRVSANKWQPSPAAGTPAIGTPGDVTVGLGVTIGGTLEMSNVDLAQEFTQMIVGQRGFQANSRVISVADQMMEELVNLKR